MEIVNHECYVSLEVAKLLEEAGFDWNIYTAYRDGKLVFQANHLSDNFNAKKYKIGAYEFFSAPTLEVAQRWLREVKSVHVEISYDKERMWNVCIFNIDKKVTIDNYYYEKYFDTYEEALEAGIKKALEIILEKGE